MRKDGTHTERELEKLDIRVKGLFHKLGELLEDYKKDGVGAALCYTRPKDSGKGCIYINGVSLTGNGADVVFAIRAIFDKYPELFMPVLNAMADEHPNIFKVCAVDRPKPDVTVS